MLGHLNHRFFLFKHKNDISDIHRVLWIYTIVFLVWGLYRQLFPTDVWLEETVLKFFVFGLPVFWVVKVKEKGSLEDLGMSTKGLIVSLYFGLLFGVWLAVFGNIVSFLNDGTLGFHREVSVEKFQELMMLGLFTAFWEQLLFMGYMLPKFVKDTKQEMVSVITVAILFALLHLPVQIAGRVGLDQITVRMILLFTLEVGNGVLYLRFKNLAAPIFAHLAWGSVIYLFG